MTLAQIAAVKVSKDSSSRATIMTGKSVVFKICCPYKHLHQHPFQNACVPMTDPTVSLTDIKCPKSNGPRR